MGMKGEGPELCADHTSVMKFAHDPSCAQFMFFLYHFIYIYSIYFQVRIFFISFIFLFFLDPTKEVRTIGMVCVINEVRIKITNLLVFTGRVALKITQKSTSRHLIG